MVYYRRAEKLHAPIPAWERVTVNRKDQSMKCETLSYNTDGSEALLDLHKFKCNDTGVQDEFQVYAGLGKSFKLE